MANNGRPAGIPKIPRPSGRIDPEVAKILKAVIDNIEPLAGERRNNPLDRAVRVRDLTGPKGLLDIKQNTLEPKPHVRPPDDRYDEPVRLVAPTNLAARGAFENIILTWEYPLELLKYVAFFEVHRSAVNDLASTELHLRPNHTLVQDTVGEGKTFYYWVRAVAVNTLIATDFNAADGTKGETSLSAAALIAIIKGEIDKSVLAQSLREEIDLTAAGASAAGAAAAAADLLARQNQAAITEEVKVRQEEGLSFAQTMVELGARLDLAAGAIQQETQLRIEGDEATASDVSLLGLEVDNVKTAAQQETATRADADSALAQRITTLVATVGDNKTTASDETRALSNALGSLSARYSTYVAEADENMAVIQENIAATADVAGNASARWEIKASVNDFTYGVGFHVGEKLNILADLDQTDPCNYVDQTSKGLVGDSLLYSFPGDAPAYTSPSSFSGEVSFKVASAYRDSNGNYSELQVATFGIGTAQVRANAGTFYALICYSQGSAPAGLGLVFLAAVDGGQWFPIDDIITSKTLTVVADSQQRTYQEFAVDDLVAAAAANKESVLSSSAVADFAIAAQRVWVYNPAAPEEHAYPFIVSGNKVYMNSAIIQDATIDIAKIKNLNAEIISASQAAFAELTVDFLSLNNGVVSGDLQSANYSAANSTGWKLTRAGTFHAFAGTFGGALSAATGTFAGSLSAATGTFSGTMTADAVNAVDTINLKGNAVRVAKIANFPRTTRHVPRYNADAHVRIQSVSLDLRNKKSSGRVLITAKLDGYFYRYEDDGPYFGELEVKRGNVVVGKVVPWSVGYGTINNSGDFFPAVGFDVFLDDPPSAIVTYTVVCKGYFAHDATVIFDGAKV